MNCLFNYAAVSGVGGRINNEDRYAAVINEDVSGFFVCDGLGGHASGAEAASQTVDCFVSLCSDVKQEMISPAVFFDTAQRALLKYKDGRRTTAAVVLTDRKYLYAGHIGDSRIYIFWKNKIIKKTTDHSVAALLATAGQISPEEIRVHPDRNLLTRALGEEREEPGYELLKPYPLRKCQAILLCSDGFWERITDSDICSCLKGSKSAQEWIDKMTETVLQSAQAEEMDNYTAITVMRAER